MKATTRRRLSRAVVVATGSFAAATLAIGSASAAGGTVNGDKTLGTDTIACTGTVPVTVSLTGEDGITANPADVMLVLDRSGSMSGTPLANLKVGAKKFVDVIDESSDGALDGTISSSRIGLVSFASSASLDQGLTGNANALKTAIDGLSASGNTAIGDGINLGQAQYTVPGNNKMVVFTDGQNNTGADPSTAAANAQAAGTEIWAIGLGGVNVGQLNAIGSDPDSEHVFISPDPATIEGTFASIGADIVQPAATDVTVVDTVSGDFSVQNASVTKGSVNVAGNQLTWTMDELRSETVELTFDAVHDGGLGGTLAVNPTVTYTDAEGHTVSFPNPSVDVTGCEPTVTCEETENPSGKNKPKSEQVNRDGFYVLGASDEQSEEGLQIFVADDASSAEFGPFEPGTKIKLVQSPDGEPSIREMNDKQDTDYQIKLKGDAVVTAVDSSGNVSDPVTCVVPPAPM